MNSKDFAKMLGFSQSTVSRALNGSSAISEETTQYIIQKAQEYGFVLNSSARSLKSKRTYTLGLLFPQSWESLSKNLMFTYIYDCILKELAKINYDAMIVYDADFEGHSSVLERVVKSRKLDGFINLSPVLSSDELDLMARYSTPCVSIFQPLSLDYPICQFCEDDFQAGFLAGQYFGPQTEYQTAHLSISLSDHFAARRYEGYRSALGLVDRTVDRVIECELTARSAYEAILREASFFTSHKTALFVYNDLLALGAVQALIRLGISIPDAAQVIGLGDVPMGSWVPPELSTLHTPVHDFVRSACATLKQMLDGENVEIRSSLYPFRLIHRGTTLGEG